MDLAVWRVDSNSQYSMYIILSEEDFNRRKAPYMNGKFEGAGIYFLDKGYDPEGCDTNDELVKMRPDVALSLICFASICNSVLKNQLNNELKELVKKDFNYDRI